MDPEAYLRHLGFTDARPPDLNFLSELQQRHLETVPFENLSVAWKQPIDLEVSRLATKVVGKKRGGFCYELNSLFHALLTHLGYNVTLISARVFSPLDGRVGREFDHLALLVHLDETYLVDVGFGDAHHHPIAIPAGENFDRSGHYRVVPPAEDGRLHLQRHTPEGWKSLYDFTVQPRQFSDFAAMCVYHQTSPDSIFALWKICTRLTPTGRVTLMRDELILTGPEGKQRQPISSDEAYDQALREYFGIEAPEFGAA
jgi:N-hydroxyarylamine O-acetyltransferase